MEAEQIEGISNDRLRFYSRHSMCTKEIHRCCEYTVEIPAEFARKTKIWTLVLGGMIFFNGWEEPNTFFVCLFACFVLFTFWKICTVVTKESILVEMEMIGIQQTTVYWFGWKVTEILHSKDVVDVVINEAITMGQVIFYLTVIMKDKSLKPLFMHSKPRLRYLVKIYQGIQQALYHQKSFSKTQKLYYSCLTSVSNNCS